MKPYTLEDGELTPGFMLSVFTGFPKHEALRERDMHDLADLAVVFAPDYVRAEYPGERPLGLSAEKVQDIFRQYRVLLLPRGAQARVVKTHGSEMFVTANRDLTVTISRDDFVAPTDPALKFPQGSLEQRAQQWLCSNDTGASSGFLVGAITGLRTDFSDEVSYPHDIDDFGCCHRMLEWLPELRTRLPKVAQDHPEWAPLIEHWDELTKLYLAALHPNPSSRGSRFDVASPAFEQFRVALKPLKARASEAADVRRRIMTRRAPA